MSATVRIVLVETRHPGNIGGSARAMATMGLESLVLVRPAANLDDEAFARAAGAAEVLRRARIVADIGEAIGDCGLVLGATARPRSANWRVLDARAAAIEVAAACDRHPVAILFGNERNGLSNAELERCGTLACIPAAGDYGSLNLAQAVQVFAYEIAMARRARAPARAVEAPPTADEVRALEDHVERVMRRSGFMHAGNAGSLGARLRRLLARARPDAGELRILRGFLAAVERGLRHDP